MDIIGSALRYGFVNRLPVCGDKTLPPPTNKNAEYVGEKEAIGERRLAVERVVLCGGTGYRERVWACLSECSCPPVAQLHFGAS